MKRRNLVKGALLGTIGGLSGCQLLGGTDGEDDGQTPEETTDAPTPDEGENYQQVRNLVYWSLPRSNQADLFEYGRVTMQNWERLGLNFEWVVMDNSERISRKNSGETEMDLVQAKLVAGSQDRLEPYQNMVFSFYQPSTEGVEWTPEYNGEAVTEYRDHVDEYMAAYETEPQVEAAQNALEVLAEEQPVPFLFHPEALVAANTTYFTNWNEAVGDYAYTNPLTFRDLEAAEGRETLTYGNPRSIRGYPNFMDIGVSPEALMIYNLVYDSLVAMDYRGGAVPRAAESWDVENETEIIFNLRDNQWHDGEPVTAEDVKFTWDYFVEWEVPYLSTNYAQYESSDVIDESTIRINLSEPFGPFVNLNCWRMPILPQHIWEGVTDREGIDEPSQWQDPDVTGSGPMIHADFETGNRILLETNSDHYWGQDYPFEEFVWEIYGSQTSAVGDLVNDRIDIVQSLPPTPFNRAESADNVKAVANDNTRMDAVYHPNNVDPYHDKAFRHAMAYATEIEDMIQLIYEGRASKARHTVAPFNEKYFDDSARLFPDDIGQGRQTLQEAGYRWDEEGNLLVPEDKLIDRVPLAYEESG